MIDVMKRLAEIDAGKSKLVKENQSVAECGPMGMMDSMPGMHGMMAEKPSVPANFSINASAGSGDEVASMMSQILTLAGMKQVGGDDLGAEPLGALVTAEPGMSVGPMAAEPMPSATDDMRSVLDKLNPEPSGDEEGGDEDGKEIGPFQHDSDDSQLGADEEDDEEDDEETDEGYDNTPADPNSANPFDSNEFANQENQPGSGETSNGEKRQSNLPTATFENLMKEYKSFIGESEEDDEDMEEGIEDRLKDLDPKNPVNIPAYKRKAASGDSADAVRNTKETANESMADILKLSGLKK